VLAAHLQDQGVQHLHNHIAKASCTVAMLVNALSNLPYSFTIHGPDIFFAPDHWRIDEKAARARFVACISDYCRSQLMCFADQSHWDRFHIVHCGVDPLRYTASSHQGESLLFVGRLAAVKGVPILLDVLPDLLKTHPKLTLTLIGDGPDRAALEQQVQSLGLGDCVTFLGYRNQDEVAEALMTTDVFVLPSFAEGVPVVLMEAMAAGVPVVTTQIAGVPELVKQAHTGFLVPPGDGPALAEAVDRLLQDNSERMAMGDLARDTVDIEYNVRRETRWLSDLMQSYAADPHARPKKRRGFAE
jgi:glycosyltransferase involved in cell wall biosynthesis